MEVKSIFYSLLLNFTLEATEETEIPVKIAKNQMMMALENGLRLALVPRN
jgi:cytochrome P450 family 9